MEILPYLIFLVFLIAVVFFTAKFLLNRVQLITEGKVGIIERQGRFVRVLDPGRHFLLPFDRIREEVPLQEFGVESRVENIVMHNAVMVEEIEMYLKYRIAHYQPQQVSAEQARQMQPEPVIQWSRGRIRQRDIYNAVYKVDSWQEETQKEAKAVLRSYLAAIDANKDIFGGSTSSLKQISAIIKKQVNDKTLQYGVEILEISLGNPKIDENSLELLTSVPRSQMQSHIKQMEAETQNRIQQMEADAQLRIQQTLKLSREELLQWYRTETLKEISQNNPNARIYMGSEEVERFGSGEGQITPKPSGGYERPSDGPRSTRPNPPPPYNPPYNDGERR